MIVEPEVVLVTAAAPETPHPNDSPEPRSTSTRSSPAEVSDESALLAADERAAPLEALAGSAANQTPNGRALAAYRDPEGSSAESIVCHRPAAFLKLIGFCETRSVSDPSALSYQVSSAVLRFWSSVLVLALNPVWMTAEEPFVTLGAPEYELYAGSCPTPWPGAWPDPVFARSEVLAAGRPCSCAGTKTDTPSSQSLLRALLMLSIENGRCPGVNCCGVADSVATFSTRRQGSKNAASFSTERQARERGILPRRGEEPGEPCFENLRLNARDRPMLKPHHRDAKRCPREPAGCGSLSVFYVSHGKSHDKLQL